MRRRRIAVFGSTGSIGKATLDVIGHLSTRFEVSVLVAHSSSRIIAAQARRFLPSMVVLSDQEACVRTRQLLGPGFRVESGLGPMLDAAASAKTDIVVMAMSGTAGVLPVMAALERGKHVCLATKEILVSFGSEVTETAHRYGAQLLPIDSELAGLHQCLEHRSRESVRKVILTASGGPFRRTGPPERAAASQVLAHPTWRMGRKVTVDSATLMNKGLEAIEAVRLFELRPEQVEAVIHPQSIVHALIEFQDGSLLAQLANPDMRLPIQYCLTYPERLDSVVRPLNLSRVGRLEFATVDERRFPCYRLARSALRLGPAATCVLNAANQVAVQAFLQGRIALGAIPRIISRTMLALGVAKKNIGRRSVRVLLRLEQKATTYAHCLVRSCPAPGGRPPHAENRKAVRDSRQ